MPYQKRKKDKRFEVFDTATGAVAPNGEHASEAAADAHLQKLAKSAPVELLEGQPIPQGVFIPITKIDEARREVWGWAALEEPDHAGEIMDYASSKPYWERWSGAAQKRTGGASLGNVREMHEPRAAGKLIAFQPQDAEKGFFVGSRVVDDAAWNKVASGVYTGFSVGGSYAKRWRDPANPHLVRYTADPSEISLVDAPCIPGAVFQVVKADGLTESRALAGGQGADVLKLDLDGADDGADNGEPLDKVQSPAPVGAIVAGEDVVQTIPNQDRPMPIGDDPAQAPSGDVTTARHGGVEPVGDLPALETTAVQKVLPGAYARVKHSNAVAKVRRPTAPRMVKAV